MRKRFAMWLGLLVMLALVPAFAKDLASGVDVGGTLSAYNPHHLTGPDAGTNTCPICKYGNAPAVQVWINSDKDANIQAIAAALHQAVQAHSGLHAFITVIGKPQADVQKLASQVKYADVAITYLDPKNQAVSDYQINTDPQVANTVFVYRDRHVKQKFVNLVADSKGVTELQSAIGQLFN